MIIGITGGVGCGKSAVMDMLKNEFGAEVILADNVGHEVMNPGMEAYFQIVGHFGSEILDDDGKVDRKKLGGYVFNNKEELLYLNSIIHPAVKKRILGMIDKIQADCKEKGRQQQPLIAIEAALLLEDNYDAVCDKVIYVYADEKSRRQRLKESRGYSDEKTDSIMNNQMSEEEFTKRCDDVLDNSQNLSVTYNNLKKIVDKYKGLCYSRDNGGNNYGEFIE